MVKCTDIKISKQDFSKRVRWFSMELTEMTNWSFDTLTVMYVLLHATSDPVFTVRKDHCVSSYQIPLFSVPQFSRFFSIPTAVQGDSLHTKLIVVLPLPKTSSCS